MKKVIIDVEQKAQDRIISAIEKAEESLDKRFINLLFTDHTTAYQSFSSYRKELKLYIVKISTHEEIEEMQKLQSLRSDVIFLLWVEDEKLASDAIELTISNDWILTTVQTESALEKIVQKVFIAAFTSQTKPVEIGGYTFVPESVLYMESSLKYKNYIHVVAKGNECLARTTLKQVATLFDSLVQIDRHLVVNRNNVRRVSTDGGFIYFVDSPTSITVAARKRKDVRKLF